ncbi:MAG: DUF5131 family protein, partial [Bacteroidales bacterium]|nr:DUF5131 family protein [Bacteroidales bacterium]
GYDNVVIASTVENQEMADYRITILKKLSIKHKLITCAPLLEKINLNSYLDSSIEEVSAGGESGNEARECDYDWILNIREQCIEKDIPFWFHQTGAKLRKNGKLYRIKRQYQHSQARKANINYKTNHNI